MTIYLLIMFSHIEDTEENSPCFKDVTAQIQIKNIIFVSACQLADTTRVYLTNSWTITPHLVAEYIACVSFKLTQSQFQTPSLLAGSCSSTTEVNGNSPWRLLQSTLKSLGLQWVLSQMLEEPVVAVLNFFELPPTSCIYPIYSHECVILHLQII